MNKFKFIFMQISLTLICAFFAKDLLAISKLTKVSFGDRPCEEISRKIFRDPNEEFKLSDVNELEIKNLNLSKGYIHSPLLNGSTHEGIFLGTYEDQNIIVKKIPFKNKNDISKSLNEIELSIKLSELNLSPQFYGVVHFEDGNIGIVTKAIMNSYLLRNYKLFELKLSLELKNELDKAITNSTPEIRQKWREQISFILDQLTGLNIRAEDFQVLLCSDGRVFVIDLRHFTKTTHTFRPINANINQSIKLEFTNLIKN